ncbi:MAG: PBP1A family penicillin-binding protein [Leptospiraceae bacterium]|nr:PBP1A family penicillin-binding protein [Leptospiraceae bacterium]MCP5497508.1 PBP1A family penicillin-binding protein [Leptospiraceae bacterium]
MTKKSLRNVIAFIGSVALLGGLLFGYIISEVNRGEMLYLLSSYQPTTPTRLYDINGIPFAELYQHRQELLKYQDIPPHVIQAFLSVEDDNFYNHFGIDFMAIMRAVVINTIHFGIKQGGSTLTQQLAKAVLKNTKRSFARKFKEALLTLQIEQEYSKEEILEIYFNLIYLGHGSTGLSTAASVYFSKDVRDLDIAEAALLARLPKAPVKYSPFKNPKIAKNAHLEILKKMADNGFIPKDQVEEIHKNFWLKYWPIVITQSPSKSQWGSKLDRAPYFTEHVRRQLIQDLGSELVYTGGLKVYTTLDLEKQLVAEEEIVKALTDHDKTYYGMHRVYQGGVDGQLVGYYSLLGSIFPIGVPFINRLDENAIYRVELEKSMVDSLDILTLLSPVENEASAVSELRKRTAVYIKNLHVEGAVITIEPSTGHIVTMVGGAKFTPKNQFNRATQARRQTGSSFKPFVYGAAIQERVIGTGTGLMDAPLMTLSDAGQGWAPEDSTGDFQGMVPAQRALGLSLNIVSVQLYYKTGPEPIIDFASKLTKANRRYFPPNPSLSLGVAELTPFEMALGYAIIANKGKNVIPFSIRHIMDQSGNIIINKEKEVQNQLIEQAKNGTIQIVPEDTAWITKKMLIGVAQGGTPTASLRQAGFKGISGGKTGSTNSFADAWYVGFDPQYTTAVWMGYDKSSVSLGRGMYASVVTAPIWGKIYSRWYEGKEFPDFGEDPMPEGVVGGGTCAKNGLTPKPGVCLMTSNYHLKPIKVGDHVKSIPYLRMCDGERDHQKTMEFEDFLKNQYEITDDELRQQQQQQSPIANEPPPSNTDIPIIPEVQD